MRYVFGPTLSDLIAHHNSFDTKVPVGLALDLIRQLATALRHMHRKRPIVIHRDLKSCNILLDFENVTDDSKLPTRRWKAVIADYGLAMAETDPSITGPGVVAGTIDSMAPETADGDQKFNPAADVYALGVIAHELFTGVVPFSGRTIDELQIRQTLSVDVAGIKKYRRDIRQDIAKMIVKMLSDKQSRPDCDVVLKLLDDIRTKPLRDRRRRVLMAAGAAVAVVVLLLVGSVLRQERLASVRSETVRRVLASRKFDDESLAVIRQGLDLLRSDWPDLARQLGDELTERIREAIDSNVPLTDGDVTQLRKAIALRQQQDGLEQGLRTINP